MTEIIAVPWRLLCERRQPEPLPDRSGPLHELALRQRDRRIEAFERGVDQDGRAFALVARTARSVAWILVRHHLEVMLRLAEVRHRPEQCIGILGLDVLVDCADPFAGNTVEGG